MHTHIYIQSFHIFSFWVWKTVSNRTMANLHRGYFVKILTCVEDPNEQHCWGDTWNPYLRFLQRLYVKLGWWIYRRHKWLCKHEVTRRYDKGLSILVLFSYDSRQNVQSHPETVTNSLVCAFSHARA